MRNKGTGRIRRLSALMLAAITMLSLLTGCGSKEHGLDPKKPQDITVWHYYNGSQAEAFDAMVEEFNSSVGQSKGIHVTAVSKGSVDDLIAALTASADKSVGAEEMPDIYQCYLDMATDLDKAGLMVDLNGYLDKAVIDEYIDSFVEEGRFSGDGSLKLFPVAKSTEVFMMNKTDWDDFAAATGHSPEELSTWEGMAAVAKDYYERSGKSFFGRDAFANYVLVGSAQLGHDIFRVENGSMKLDLDEGALRRLWDNYYVPFVRGYYGQNGRYRSDDIKTGDLIAQVCSTSSAAYFTKEVTRPDGSTYPIDYMVLPLPNFDGCAPYAVQQGASMAVVPSTETREYAAVTFLRYFTESQRNIRFAAEAGYLPVRKDACTVEAFEDYKQSIGVDKSVKLDAIAVAIKQTNQSYLYTTAAFENGTAARNKLGYSMIDLAVADRAAVVEAVAAGASEQEALAPYLTQDYFAQWCRDLTGALTPFEGN